MNKDNKIQRNEFIQYVKKDKQILSCLFDYGLAKKQDFGTNMGGGDLPEYDSDLEAEINPKELERDEKHQ